MMRLMRFAALALGIVLTLCCGLSAYGEPGSVTIEKLPFGAEAGDLFQQEQPLDVCFEDRLWSFDEIYAYEDINYFGGVDAHF